MMVCRRSPFAHQMHAMPKRLDGGARRARRIVGLLPVRFLPSGRADVTRWLARQLMS
jgi:hypothetical protein